MEDPFHCWHLGPGRVVCARGILLYTEARYPALPRLARLAAGYSEFQQFSVENHLYPAINSFRQGLGG